METFKSIAIGGLAVVALLFGYLFFTKPLVFGLATGPTHQQLEQFRQGLLIGDRFGTELKAFNSGTCNLLGMDASAAATSTTSYDCAVTGVLSTDKVEVDLGTSSPAVLYGGWPVMNAYASTTNGFITVRVMNLTGAAVVPSTRQVGSSTEYRIYRF